MRITYTPEAVHDLKRLREFIAEHNPRAANRIAKNIQAGISKLKVFPQMGLSVSKAPDPEMIRDLYVGDYTVRYLLNRKIYILRVWHGKEVEKDS